MEHSGVSERLVSVIVPSYNSSAYIEKCAASILSQSHKNLELVIVDDGATDDSPQKVDRLASRDSRVVVVHQENKGLPKARLAGYLASSGEFVTFVDSDDWLEPNAVALMLEALLATNADVASCDVRWEYEDDRKPWNEGPNEDRVFNREEALKALYERTSVYEYVWNKLYRRGVISPEVFPEVGSMGEDYFTVLGILLRAKRVAHVGKPLYHYLQQAKSMSQGAFGQGHVYSYHRYLADEKRMVEQYPNLAEVIKCYTSVRLLIIILPMARNGNYDRQIISYAQQRYKKTWGSIMAYGGFGAYWKAAVTLFAMSPATFFSLYYRMRYKQKLPYPLK